MPKQALETNTPTSATQYISYSTEVYKNWLRKNTLLQTYRQSTTVQMEAAVSPAFVSSLPVTCYTQNDEIDDIKLRDARILLKNMIQSKK